MAENNTHKINVGAVNGINRWLRLATTPSQAAVTDDSQILDIQSFLETDIIFENGTEFILLEEGFGFECNWDYVKIQHPKKGELTGHFYNKFIEPIDPDDDTLWDGYECNISPSVGLLKQENWTIKVVNKPYYDKLTKRWRVSVESIIDSDTTAAEAQDLDGRMEACRKIGLEMILEENGKKTTDPLGESTTLKNILDKRLGALAENYYMPSNPKKNMKVLVSFPAKYLINIADVENTYVPSSNSISYTMTGPHSYESKIKQAIIIMNFHAQDINKYKGTVENIDLEKEMARLTLINSKLKSILEYNNIVINDALTVELGFVETGAGTSTMALECVYIAENSTAIYKNITKGIHTFLDEEPFDSSRTMNYLFNLEGILSSKAAGETWEDFLKNYTKYPTPRIIRTVPKGESAEDTRGQSSGKAPGSTKNPDAAAEMLEEKLEKMSNIYNSLGMGQPCNNGYSFSDLGEDLSGAWDATKASAADSAAALIILQKCKKFPPGHKERPSDKACKEVEPDPLITREELRAMYEAGVKGVKTAASDAKAAALLALEDAKGEMLDEAEHLFENTKDKIFDELDIKIEQINNLDDVYKEVLNKICITDLTIPALACFKPPEWYDDYSEDYRNMMAQLPVSMCNEEDKEGGWKACIPTLALPDNIKTFDWLDAYSKIIWAAILDLLKQIFVLMVKDLFKLLLDMCKEKDEDDETPAESILRAGANENIIGLLDLAIVPEGSNILDLLSDLADALSPRALCRLFSGRASQETLTIVRQIVRARYPELTAKFRTRTNIADFFSTLGSAVDTKMCQDLAKLPHEPDPSCRSPYDPSPSLEGKLSNRPEELSAEQVDKQLVAARKRKKENIDRLASIVDLLNNSKPGTNPFQDMAPPLLCGPDGAGLLDLSHESHQFAQDVVLDTMFSGIKMSFNREADQYTKNFLKRQMITTQIEYNIIVPKEPTGTQVIRNPEVDRMIANGVKEEMLEKQARDNRNFVNRVEALLLTDRRSKFLLENIETNNVLAHGRDREGPFSELVLPPNTDALSLLGKMDEALDVRIGDDNKTYTEIMTENQSEWRIRYKTPYIPSCTAGADAEITDEYTIEIFPSKNQEDQGVLRKNRTVPMDLNIAASIEDESLNISIEVGNDWRNLSAVEVSCEFANAPTTYCLPLPNTAFANYAKKLWSDRLTATDNTKLAAFLDNDIKLYFAKEAHENISKDIISLVANRISESPLYENRKQTADVMGFSMITYSSEITKINLDRRPSALEEACNIDPHLLRIKQYKQELADEIMNNSCIAEDLEKMNIDGTPRAEPDKFESFIINTMIKMTIRTYLIDYAMRGIFPLTEFQTKTDEYYLDFILKKITADMKGEFGEVYLGKIRKYANIVHTNMIGSKEITPESISIKPDADDALRAIIKKTLPGIYTDLKCIIEEDLGAIGTTIFPPAPLDPKELFVKEWLPLFDLQKTPGQVRFSEKGKDLDNVEEKLAGYFIVYPELKRNFVAAEKAKETAYENYVEAQETFQENLAIYDAAVSAFIAVQDTHYLRDLSEAGNHGDLLTYGKWEYDNPDNLIRSIVSPGSWHNNDGCSDNVRDANGDESMCTKGGAADWRARYWKIYSRGLGHSGWKNKEQIAPKITRAYAYRSIKACQAGYPNMTKEECRDKIEERVHHDIKSHFPTRFEEYKHFVDPQIPLAELNTEMAIQWDARIYGACNSLLWSATDRKIIRNINLYGGGQASVVEAINAGQYDNYEYLGLGPVGEDDPQCGALYDAWFKLYKEEEYNWLKQRGVDVIAKETTYEEASTLFMYAGEDLNMYSADENFSPAEYVEVEEDDEYNVVRAFQKLDLKSEAKSIIEKTQKFDLSNGNLYLEKFWKILRRTNTELAARNTNSGHKTAFDAALIKNFGVLAADIDKPHYINIDLFKQQFEEFKKDLTPNAAWKVENWFKEFTPGIRLVYLPPVTPVDLVRAEYELGWAKGNLQDQKEVAAQKIKKWGRWATLLEACEKAYQDNIGECKELLSNYDIAIAGDLGEERTDGGCTSARTAIRNLIRAAYIPSDAPAYDSDNPNTVEFADIDIIPFLSNVSVRPTAATGGATTGKAGCTTNHFSSWTGTGVSPGAKIDLGDWSNTKEFSAVICDFTDTTSGLGKTIVYDPPTTKITRTKFINDTKSKIQQGIPLLNFLWVLHDNIKNFGIPEDWVGFYTGTYSYVTALWYTSFSIPNNSIEEDSPDPDDKEYTTGKKTTAAPFGPIPYDTNGVADYYAIIQNLDKGIAAITQKTTTELYGDFYVKAMIAQRDQGIRDSLDGLFEREQSYYIREDVERQEFNLGTGLSEDYMLPGTSTTIIERHLYPTPLVDTTTSNESGTDECGDPWGASPDYYNWYDVNKEKNFQVDNSLIHFEESDFIPNEAKKLFDDRNKEFGLLFDYVFPLNRYLSMLKIYCTMVSSELPEIGDSFSSTKEQIYSLITILTSGGGIKHNKDPYGNDSGTTNDKWREFVEDSEPEKNTCCYKFEGMSISKKDYLNGKFFGDINLNLDVNPFASLGRKEIAKMLEDTGDKILKQIAELGDPNIALAKPIYNALKLVGVCNLKMWHVSMGLLPMNIFPFSPGPPLTPFGMYYLYNYENRPCNIKLPSPQEKAAAEAQAEADNCPETCIDATGLGAPATTAPGGFCKPDKKYTEKCGINKAGDRERQCDENGAWEGPWTECVDDDICINNDTKIIPCGVGSSGRQVQTCKNGAWDKTADCQNEPACLHGKTATVPNSCGWNTRGTTHKICMYGEWVSDRCEQYDQCKIGTKTNLDKTLTNYEKCGRNLNGDTGYDCRDVQITDSDIDDNKAAQWVYKACDSKDECTASGVTATRNNLRPIGAKQTCNNVVPEISTSAGDIELLLCVEDSNGVWRIETSCIKDDNSVCSVGEFKATVPCASGHTPESYRVEKCVGFTKTKKQEADFKKKFTDLNYLTGLENPDTSELLAAGMIYNQRGYTSNLSDLIDKANEAQLMTKPGKWEWNTDNCYPIQPSRGGDGEPCRTYSSDELKAMIASSVNYKGIHDLPKKTWCDVAPGDWSSGEPMACVQLQSESTPSCRPDYVVNWGCKPGTDTNGHDRFTDKFYGPPDDTCNIKVLCGELYEQGILDTDIYKADIKHSLQYANTPVQLGYWYLADPVVDAMRESKLVTKLVSPFVISWAEHMAYKEKSIEKDNILGLLMQLIGVPVAYIIGLGLNILNTSKVKSYKKKMEALSNIPYEELIKLIKEKENKNQ